MRLIFSKDRAAQLDLLLRSLRRFAGHELTKVLWTTSSDEFTDAYMQLPVNRADWMLEEALDLELRRALWECPDEMVTFFCDDDVVFREMPDDLMTKMGTFSFQVLTGSFRLGRTNPLWPGNEVWGWADLPRTDFGFPGSIDAHTFRVSDVLWMIEDHHISNPTMLETVLAQMCEHLAQDRPLMTCDSEQSVVGVPVNRVSESSGVPFGEVFPQTTEELNDRFLQSARISLADAIADLSNVTACHQEIEFRWETR